MKGTLAKTVAYLVKGFIE